MINNIIYFIFNFNKIRKIKDPIFYNLKKEKYCTVIDNLYSNKNDIIYLIEQISSHLKSEQIRTPLTTHEFKLLSKRFKLFYSLGVSNTFDFHESLVYIDVNKPINNQIVSRKAINKFRV